MLSTEPSTTKHQRPMNNHNNHNRKPRKRKAHPHIEYLQEQIDSLKTELKEIEQLETKQDELTQEEKQLVESKSQKEAHLEQTVTILDKLSEPTMAGRSTTFHEQERKRKTDDYILTALQFFYIVRLGQQGFLSIINQVTPLSVDVESLTNICDQLVGASLYAAKDPTYSNRHKHKMRLLDILNKLDQGVDEPIHSSATTSYKQVKTLIDHIMENTRDERAVVQNYPNINSNSPTWIVMPYESMLKDLSLKEKDNQQQQQHVANNTNKEDQQQQQHHHHHHHHQRQHHSKKGHNEYRRDNLTTKVPKKDEEPDLAPEAVDETTMEGKEKETEKVVESSSSLKEEDKKTEKEKTEENDNDSTVKDEQETETETESQSPSQSQSPLPVEQEQDKSDTDEKATTTVSTNSEKVHNSESDDWRRRDPDGPRRGGGSRGRGGRGYGRGVGSGSGGTSSGRGYIRGSRGRGHGKRPRGSSTYRGGAAGGAGADEHNNSNNEYHNLTTSNTDSTTS